MIFLLLIITYQVLNNSIEITNSIKFSIDIWKNNIFPSILPFFIISSLLINYGIINISKIISPLMRLFGIDKNISFVFIMSIFSGFPSNSKYLKELLDKKIIDIDTSSKALLFTHFSNPLFILSTLSIYNMKIAIAILIVHYITNIIIGIIFKNYHNSYINTKDNTNIEKLSFSIVLTNSIKSSIEVLLIILGTIATCSIISCIINDIFNTSDITKSLISGIIEITQGLKYISLTKLSLKLKVTISTMLLSFGGLSIHLQIKSIIPNIKYIPYLLARILHAIISGGIIYLIFNFL